jgi:D-alanyl-lipoteichoic acid acyltransferase DltB (MBOAT superfamily)
MFLLAVFLLYYLVNNRYKFYVLFAGSLFFIATISFEVALFSIIFATINYFLGILLGNAGNKPTLRVKIFWLCIAIDVGFLAFFKYINFFFENINALFSVAHSGAQIPYLNLIVPVGISYYTFQALGYLIRINRGYEKAEKNYVKFATFLLFFPKFLSGPVERSNHFFPQIENAGNFNRENGLEGLRLFLWGAFKKIVIANNLYAPVSLVYNDIHSYSGISLIAVLFIQTIYIYCDFSGYTDMALGSAKILGINLVDNFNRPFLAKSISEFWKRWHISLSSWCNDFIFNPFIVKYRKLGNKAAVMGIFLTFFIIGIWHGAKWTFILLGLLQGIAIVYEFYTKRIRLKIASRLPALIVNMLSRILVFIFMSISIVFFFSDSLSDAWYFLSHLVTDIKFDLFGHGLIYDKTKFLMAFGCFVLIFIVEILNEKGMDLPEAFIRQPRWVRWTAYYICMLLIYFFNSEISSFVYMKY